jgi:hypothetical protein
MPAKSKTTGLPEKKSALQKAGIITGECGKIVLKSHKGKTLGKHTSRAKAVKQEQAIHAAKHGEAKPSWQAMLDVPLRPDDIAYFDSFTEKCAAHGVNPVTMMIKAGAPGMAMRLLKYLIGASGRLAGGANRIAGGVQRTGGNLLRKLVTGPSRVGGLYGRAAGAEGRFWQALPDRLRTAGRTFTQGYQRGMGTPPGA